MFHDSGYREIISGRRTGVFSSLSRAALCLPELGYSAAVFARNRMFDWGIRRVHRAQVPVISVGNLTVGGTGKTPLVLWLAQWFSQRGVRPVLLSRGYGVAQGHRNDEALELELRAPEIRHLQNPDRVRSAEHAVAEHGAQVLILDDGFQHRRLGRNVDIVLIDASQPFGFNHLLPRGLLRESISSLHRAHAVVLTRVDLVSADDRRRIRDRIWRYAPEAVWAEVEFAPTQLMDVNQNVFSLSELRTSRVFGFAGIGQPENFRCALQKLTDQLVGFRSFPDHHAYTADDIRRLAQAGRNAAADFLICTWKDLVKIPADWCDSLPLRAVTIETKFTQGCHELEQLLAAALTAR